jgi:hypothetical protein
MKKCLIIEFDSALNYGSEKALSAINNSEYVNVVTPPGYHFFGVSGLVHIGG